MVIYYILYSGVSYGHVLRNTGHTTGVDCPFGGIRYKQTFPSVLHYDERVRSFPEIRLSTLTPQRRSLTLSRSGSSFFLPPMPIMLFRVLLVLERLSIGFILMLTPLRLLFNTPLLPDGVLGFSSFFLPRPRLPNGELEGALLPGELAGSRDGVGADSAG